MCTAASELPYMVTSGCMVSGVLKEQDGCEDDAGEDVQEVLQAV